jgi:hypothetical protein
MEFRCVFEAEASQSALGATQLTTACDGILKCRGLLVLCKLALELGNALHRLAGRRS